MGSRKFASCFIWLPQ